MKEILKEIADKFFEFIGYLITVLLFVLNSFLIFLFDRIRASLHGTTQADEHTRFALGVAAVCGFLAIFKFFAKIKGGF